MNRTSWIPKALTGRWVSIGGSSRSISPTMLESRRVRPPCKGRDSVRRDAARFFESSSGNPGNPVCVQRFAPPIEFGQLSPGVNQVLNSKYHSDSGRAIRRLGSDISATACLKPERHPRMIERAL